MIHAINYSDEEQENQKQRDQNLEDSVAQSESTNAPHSVQNLGNLIKEYQNKINATQIPLKSVIFVKLNKQISQQEEDQSQSSRTDSFKINQKYQHLEQGTPRSKHPNTFQPYNLRSTTDHQQDQAKTKFRSLSFNRVRRVNGPHSQIYFNKFNLQKTKEPDITQEKQIYYSDASEAEGNVDTPRHSQQQQVPSCKLQENIPEAQKNEGKFMVNKHNISKLYQYISIQLQSAQYFAQQNEDPFFQRIFTDAVADLSYKASTQRSSHLLSKGRHFVVRKIMEVYSHIPPKTRHQERFVRNRLTIRQRDMMIKANLPIPPPRLTTEFLNVLFNNKNFRQFFKEFIYTGQLQQILMDRSKVQIAKYDSYYKQIGHQKLNLQQKLMKLKRDPPPLSWLQIRLFMQEAYAMSDRYCNQS